MCRHGKSVFFSHYSLLLPWRAFLTCQRNQSDQGILLNLAWLQCHQHAYRLKQKRQLFMNVLLDLRRNSLFNCKGCNWKVQYNRVSWKQDIAAANAKVKVADNYMRNSWKEANLKLSLSQSHLWMV